MPNIVIDGKAADWQNTNTATNASGTIAYAVANDAADLYLLLKIAAPAEQMKLLRGGMEVYFDPQHNHSKNTEIIYPVKGELGEEDLRPRTTNGEKPDMAQTRAQMANQLISLNRIGFKPEYNGVQSIRQNTGFKAAISWDENNNLIYELKVPFAAFPNLQKDKIEVGFFINAVDKPKADESGHSGNWNGGNGGGNRMGGGRGNGDYGGRQGGGSRTAQNNSNSWQKMYEAESFWVQYPVAVE